MQTGFVQNPRRGSGGVAGPDRKEPALIPSASGDAFQMGSLKPAADPVESLTGGEGVGAKASAPISGVQHGTSNGYGRYGCRCDACRAAETARQRDFRQRQREGRVKHRTHDPNTVPVLVRGKLYPSISAAASALGISGPSISHQLQRYGCADRAGLGLFGPRVRCNHKAKPVKIHGREFPSIAAAARFMGVSPTHLYRSLKHGFAPTYSEFLLRQLMQADARKRRSAA
ncbi:helix-turn-helix domain-containing protein [Paracoccus laeviglucosivorans]|uniref:Nuclease-associated modular DNA-binding 1 domain-containing protein n=1 Tax=Paracoccus laeviglucosivorans TaxID=1197861 RepID=A0A521CWW7_9RHOB|nr:LysR family transcriptional regulator [Paracoccus laeviglucosivorans]SMO63934.1 hypothetical protein SAMN06265221_105228 [Paracoccus laeviglucosivorans]